MKKNRSPRRKRTAPKTILQLPDLDHAKAAVLNSLTCPDAQRGYRHAIDEFIDWYCSEPRLSFNKTVVLRYRIHLEYRKLAAGTINLRLGAVRRLAYEAADCGLLSPDLAAGIRRVKGVKKIGVRLGNWLTGEQAQALWQAPDGTRVKGKRDRTLLAILLACDLRRREIVELSFDHLQQREEHWAIVDLFGKGGHVRTIPLPAWVKQIVDDWLATAGISNGKLFRRVSKAGRVWGQGVTDKVIWHIVKEFSKKVGINKLAPHDLRRSCAGCATRREANWNRFSFCWAMFRCKRPSDTWGANSASELRSTIASVLSQTLEGWPRRKTFSVEGRESRSNGGPLTLRRYSGSILPCGQLPRCSLHCQVTADINQERG